MRYALLGLVLAMGQTQALSGQVPLPYGGCQDGAELGFTLVTAATALREVDTGRAFTRVLPGDELRLCRFESTDAVVTVWDFAYGYRIPKQAVDSLRPPTIVALSANERNCVRLALDRVQRDYRSRDQGRELLVIARRLKVSLSQIAAERLQMAREYGAGADPLLHATCSEP